MDRKIPSRESILKLTHFHLARYAKNGSRCLKRKDKEIMETEDFWEKAIKCCCRTHPIA